MFGCSDAHGQSSHIAVGADSWVLLSVLFCLLQFPSPVVDLWSIGSGRLHRVIPGPDSSHITMPNTVLLGSYNGQLYVQPIHPSPRTAPQALGGPLQSVKASPLTFSMYTFESTCGGWGQGPDPGADVAVSQLLLPTSSPPGEVGLVQPNHYEVMWQVCHWHHQL